jgi:uncharacterized oxidoreductase
MSKTFKHEPLTRAIEAIVAAGGSSPEEARLVAENLVLANLLGHDSHGIGMIPRYIDALLEGGLVVNQKVRVTTEAGSLLALDGGRGYGQSIGRQAMQMAIERAKRHGSCILSLGNSHHLGRIGHWAEMAVGEGFISLHFVNVLSHARVAPYAGRDARFGTNPCCIAIPLPGEPPFVLDYATSAVAQGKLRVAHNKGEKVPLGLLIDTEGNATQDPRFAVVPPFGAMQPFGGYKGSGMAIACELLGGALTGGGTWHHPESDQQRVLNGMLAIVLDPTRLGTVDAFQREAREFLDWLRQARPAPGFDKVRIAGEPEREKLAQRRREGIAVDATTWKEIEGAAAKVRLSQERVNALAQGTA